MQVLHPSWLWKHSSDQQAGFKHLTVVGRYDTAGPLADLFNYIEHIDKGGFVMANLLMLKYKKVSSNTSKLNTDRT